MNRLRYITCFAVLIFLLAACNKDSNNSNPGAITTVVTNTALGTTYGGEPAIPSGAAGAFYAINGTVVSNGLTTTTGSAFAWFGNATTTLPAGAVTANGYSLSSQAPFAWYQVGPQTAGLPNSIGWNVGGSGSVAGFSDTDNTAFPVVTNFALPDSISASAPLTVSFTVAKPFDVIVFTLSGGKGVVRQSSTTAGSVTFSVAQVDSATIAGDTHVGFEIVPIKTTVTAIGGNTYYFVKQYTSKQFTNTKQ